MSGAEASQRRVVESDAVLARDGSSDDPEARERVARALIEKGHALGALGRPADALACFTVLCERFGDATDAPMTGRVSEARYATVKQLLALGRAAEAEAACDELIDQALPSRAHWQRVLGQGPACEGGDRARAGACAGSPRAGGRACRPVR